MPLPLLNAEGDLPVGTHASSSSELFERFAVGTAQRRVVALRLQRLLELADGLGVARFIVFGSFVSDTARPNDVDVFLVMEDAFDLSTVAGEARLIFDHAAAQAHFGASIFWARRAACFPNEAEMVSGWGLKRDGSRRGIVEITKESQ